MKEDVTYRPRITVDSLSRALTEAGNDFASMLRRVRNPDRPAIGSWTVGETAAHAAHTLHRALADSNLKENPANLPKRYRPQLRSRRTAVYPTVDQVDAFIRHVAECAEPYGRRHSVLWRIAATCGVRRGEVVGLAWPDVDYDARAISIRQTIQIDRGSLYVKRPKSTNGYRTIGLDQDTFQQLRHHRTRWLEERAAGADYQVEPLDRNFVFRADGTGSPLNPDWFTAAFKR